MNLLNCLSEGCINVNDIDIICLSKTFLYSSIPVDYNRLSIPFYSIMRPGRSSNTKRGRICLNYKELLPIIQRDDISNLTECLVTEIAVKNGTVFLMCLYRSPSQNGRQFQFVCNSLDILLNNINSLNPAIAGYINGKCLKSYHCIDTQIIDKPTHFTNHSSSCIDLIFTSNPSIKMPYGADVLHRPALHPIFSYWVG